MLKIYQRQLVNTIYMRVILRCVLVGAKTSHKHIKNFTRKTTKRGYFIATDSSKTESFRCCAHDQHPSMKLLLLHYETPCGQVSVYLYAVVKSVT